MKALMKYSAIALLAFVTFAPAAFARGFGGGGGGFRGGGGGGGWGRGGGFGGGYGFYGGWGMGFGFDPWFYDTYGWGPWYGNGYYPNAGEIQIQTNQKSNQVFVDGGYAGLAGQMKKFALRAGTHEIELRNPQGKTFYQERVTVIPGKKLKIQSDYVG